ncbi:SurA N-terminal domain-containing protein [Candidatus Woesebacteria bacterium]|nr:SurA N-terminal domain-containing protein [Candidatus Woesebacteria bacterium]
MAANKKTSTKKVTKKTSTKKTKTIADNTKKSESKGYGIKSSEKSVLKSKRYIALVFFLIVAGTLYLLRGQYLAALVNGTPITRFSVLKLLEDQSGQQILDQLVNESLIKQAANKQNIEILETDIDKEIDSISKNIESQGQNLNDLLAMQGMTMEDLRERIDTQLTLERLLEDRIGVEKQEVDDYIEKYSDSIPEDMSAEEIEDLAREQLVQKKLQTEITKYLEELQSEANIMYFGAYQVTADTE